MANKAQWNDLAKLAQVSAQGIAARDARGFPAFAQGVSARRAD